MSTYRSVLFDLGNVLSRFDPGLFWDTTDIVEPERRAMLGPQVLHLGKLYESGQITTEEFRTQFFDLFDGSVPHGRLLEGFLSVLPEPIAGMEDLVKRVGKRHEIALVSNTNPLHFDHCLRAIPALKHFERFYVSYRLGVMKPDEGFYAGVIQGEGFPPEQMVFIDDIAENVEGARTAGCVAIQFHGAGALEEELRNLGVL